MSPDDKTKIMALRKQGLSWNEISRKLSKDAGSAEWNVDPEVLAEEFEGPRVPDSSPAKEKTPT